jgi:hypothetical protein
MRPVVWVLLAACLLACAACTKVNPNLCCISADDCAAIALPVGSSCQSGFSCVNHDCVEATCASDRECSDPLAPHCADGVCRECAGAMQCSASEPTCNLITWSCERCQSDAVCAQFAATPRCGGSGACVECTSDAQCSAAEPVCASNGACRQCEHDQECESGACDVDGTCVAEAKVVYVSPTGTDIGTCVKTQPCKSVNFARQQVTASRFHISFALGSYQGPLLIGAVIPQLSLHGNGSIFSFTVSTQVAPMISVDGNNIFVRDFELSAINTGVVECKNIGRVTLVGVHVARADKASFISGCQLSWSDSTIANAVGLSVTATTGTSSIVLKRDVFRDCKDVLNAAVIDVVVENVAIVRPINSVFTFSLSTGTITATTILDAPPGLTTQISCNTPVNVFSTIFWSPRQSVGISGSCSFTGENIIGPLTSTPSVSARNIDPLFIDIAAGNFHLQPTSPAIDQASTGPTTDIDGEARPRGAKFDIGADEAK